MDAYFCYIHRGARPVPEMKILSNGSDADVRDQLARVMADYPGARLEIFQGDRLLADIETEVAATPSVRSQRAAEALALIRDAGASQIANTR